ncbi:hypothetical protein J2J97_31935 (plasmid) [Rhizobium bangladeshense]|uniref:hypothetical protein n=1 Tax=Rhizobium bangladeshense TaxID=1138189 RepID=UPI001A99B9F0|nr:hypothetical protein [Rhizobium bangladeshense]QSY98683.1 hypothetical protein J2J97_31935 [Rhizobium bangladeshense]
MSEDILQSIRDQLREVGGATVKGPLDKQVYLVLNRNLGIEQKGIMVAYEGGGAYFFDLDRPLNQFRLVKHGFSLRVAPALADLVNAILSPSEASTEAHPENAPEATTNLLSHLKDH